MGRVVQPSKKHKFYHCIVAGISKAPRKITRDMNKSQVRQRSRMNTFIKVINQIQLDLGKVSHKWLNPKDGRKTKLRRKIRQKLTRMYFKNSKPSTRWFFKKLYF